MVLTDKSNLEKILIEQVSSAGSVGLVTHKDPDGDGLPACLMLKKILNCYGVQSSVILERDLSDKYDFLSAREIVEVFQENMHFELLILLDCHESERIGRCSPLVTKAKEVIAIDHHPSNNLIKSSYNYIDADVVSTGVLLYELFRDKISEMIPQDRKYCAEVVYTTILNDTDNFINRNTDCMTFKVCSELMNLGLIPGEVAFHFLYSRSASEMKLLGEVLSTIRIYEEGQIVFIHSTLEMLERNHLGLESTSKIIGWLKGLKNVKITAYFREDSFNKYKLSLRSNYINVNKIARIYGGGGHDKAAGCEMEGNLESIQVELRNRLIDGLKNLQLEPVVNK
ncbi:MAG: bifunctional oligoribonuclease/PAP phosphatase NrnA [Candidatus Cloacimonetes bacterium]|nr:bifunctional oligoribonuclease/PAP phosphatase NrnA [Candidatus Cloacimonadota bacterium]